MPVAPSPNGRAIIAASVKARSTHILAVVGVAALVGAAYANHFQNGFHFDDSHAILDNPFVRDLGHLPRYFSDATTFSVLPQNQSYRPVLQATLAVDYWLAGGYVPWVFQLDTFCLVRRCSCW